MTTERAVGCNSTQFQCQSGHCISNSFYCDGDYNCEDRSDEPYTCLPHNCEDSKVACPNQRNCILRSDLCDGHADCIDGWDERETLCTTNQQLIAPLVPTCSSRQFTCSHDLKCIPLSWVCDKDRDCFDGEDEKNCGIIQSTVIPAVATYIPINCPENYIRCPPETDYCIPKPCNSFDCNRLTDQELCIKLYETVLPPVTEKKSEKTENVKPSTPSSFIAPAITDSPAVSPGQPTFISCPHSHPSSSGMDKFNTADMNYPLQDSCTSFMTCSADGEARIIVIFF